MRQFDGQENAFWIEIAEFSMGLAISVYFHRYERYQFYISDKFFSIARRTIGEQMLKND